MDEKVLEEYQFHKETVVADVNSPLHLIREKEMEISGRVLEAKKEAEEIVADARRKAVEIVQKAGVEGERLSAEEETRVAAQVEIDVAKVREDAGQSVEALRGAVGDRMDKAVEYVVEVVTRV
ncbi:MAG: V-type ATPase subunit subunit G family protein [Coriobacteriia bacterium]|nr:V-type ATPase subunit subunit G family protein [Coriobacteriia bacterium]